MYGFFGDIDWRKKFLIIRSIKPERREFREFRRITTSEKRITVVAEAERENYNFNHTIKER